ncbi:MAG TPA: PilN domain-containing protein [Thermoanaerobaculia bacterium]|nr:PilN domain-containing protein [Thermoanaerobaculia bacterium]
MLRPELVARLNLARHPLVNRRPLQRVAAALWVAAALVLLVDVAVLFRHFTSSTAGNEQLVGLERDIAQEVESLRSLERALNGFALVEQNRQVEFLNARIAQRTFPWSQLFEQLGEVLPDGVRLQSLRPAVAEDDEPARPRSTRTRTSVPEARPPRWVQLQIAGEAETGAAILDLVDALFEHAAFSEPNLRNEAQQRGLYRFNLTVRYLPDLELEESGSSGETVATAMQLDGAAATGGAP